MIAVRISHNQFKQIIRKVLSSKVLFFRTSTRALSLVSEGLNFVPLKVCNALLSTTQDSLPNDAFIISSDTAETEFIIFV